MKKGQSPLSVLLPFILFCFVPFLFIITSCKNKTTVVEPKEVQFENIQNIDYSGWEKGKPGGRLSLSVPKGPETFNPLIASDAFTTTITERLFHSIANRNQLTLEWEPHLAEKWDIADNGQSITVTLRDGLKWSDGTPITAEDVVYTVNEIIFNNQVRTPIRETLTIAGKRTTWTQIDTKTFRVELPIAHAGIYSLLTIPPIPKHIVKPVIEKNGITAINSLWGKDIDPNKIVCSGAFKLKKYTPDKIILKRNFYYFEKDQWGTMLPYLDELAFSIENNPDTGISNFTTGKTDGYRLRIEDFETLKGKKENLHFDLYNAGPGIKSNFITFNINPVDNKQDQGLKKPALTWLTNKTFRKALAHLINRQLIIEKASGGYGYPQYSFVPRFSPFYWKDAKKTAPRYNPDKAKKLLDEIGYIDKNEDGIREDAEGNSISLTLNTNTGNEIRKTIAHQFIEEARKIKIDIKYKPISFTSLMGKLLSTYDWELILVGMEGAIDPINGKNILQSSGNLHMIEPNQKNPRRSWEKQIDTAWQRAAFYSDTTKRKKEYNTIQKVFIDSVPWVYTYNKAAVYACNKKFGNIKPRPINGYGLAGIARRIYVK